MFSLEMLVTNIINDNNKTTSYKLIVFWAKLTILELKVMRSTSSPSTPLLLSTDWTRILSSFFLRTDRLFGDVFCPWYTELNATRLLG